MRRNKRINVKLSRYAKYLAGLYASPEEIARFIEGDPGRFTGIMAATEAVVEAVQGLPVPEWLHRPVVVSTPVVPDRLQAVADALQARLDKTVVGDPAIEQVRMGPLVGADQARDVRANVEQLASECQVIYGGKETFDLEGADNSSGAFFPPTVLLCDEPHKKQLVHEVTVSDVVHVYGIGMHLDDMWPMLQQALAWPQF